MNNKNYFENRQDYDEHNKENINFFNQENGNFNKMGLVGQSYLNEYKNQGMSIEQHPIHNDNKKFTDTIQNKYVDISMNVKNFVNVNNQREMNNPQILRASQKISDYVNQQPNENIYQNENFNVNFDNENDKENFPINFESKNNKKGAGVELDSSSLYSTCFSSQEKENPYMPLYTRYRDKIPHDYMMDIWDNLKLEEEMNNVSYMNIMNQTDINERMRAILVDWLVEVHCRFKLSNETLFLAVNIIDRFLSINQVLRSKLQLIGVSALLIACKYEEIYCPDLKDFVYVTDKTYTKEEIVTTEKEILVNLQFNVTVPSPYRFFEVISLNFNFNEVEFSYGRYLLEFFLIDSKMNKYSSSLISLSVAYLIMKINEYPNYKEIYNLFNKNMTPQGLSSPKLLKECAKEIYYLVENAETFDKLQAVYNKFSSRENYRVAIFGMGVNCQKKNNF